MQLLEREQDADHEGEERRAFDETGRDDHRAADVATSGRLTGDAIHRRGGELTDAVAGTDDGETSAETGAEVGEHC